MARLGYIDKIQDPTSTSDYYEIVDTAAREQLAFKTEKKYVNSLPAKPTSKTTWDEVKKYIYFIPIDGATGDDIYEEWTLFFTGNESVASDYTNPNNYRYEKIGTTATDISNFSTKGHTHEVIPETTVEDHDYTPQGTIETTFTGREGTTDTNTHNHTYTPAGSVTSNFTGTSGTTESGTTGISLNKSSKKLSTKKLKLESASVSLTPTASTVAKNTFAANSGSYEADKSIFNGISVSDGVLSFVTKKLDTASVVGGVTGSTTATKVTFGGNATTEEDVATGAVESGSQLLGNNTGITDNGHTHSFTPAGSVSSSFSGTYSTTSNDSHSHSVIPNGDITASFKGVRANLKHKVDNKKIRTAPDQEDEGSHAFDWYGIEFDEAGSDPVKTRIGNLDMHKMLPIQSKMRRCLLKDDGTVNYYLDDRDSTKRAGSQEGWVETQETFISKVESDDVRDNTEYITKIEGGGIAWNQLYPSPYDGTVTLPTMVERWADANSTIPLGYLYLSEYFDNVTLPATIPSTGTWYDSNGNIMSAAPSASTAFTGWRREARVTHVAYQTWFTTGSMQRNIIDMAIIFGIDESFGYIIASPATNYTVEDMKNYLTLNVGWKTYYEYNAGDLLGTKMVGIRTTVNGVTNVYNLDVTKLFGTKDGGTEGHYYRFAKEGMRGAGYGSYMEQDVVNLVNGEGAVKVGMKDLATLTASQVTRTKVSYGFPNPHYMFTITMSEQTLFVSRKMSFPYGSHWADGYEYMYNKEVSGRGSQSIVYMRWDAAETVSAFITAMQSLHLPMWYSLQSPITFTSLFLSASSTADELTAMPADAIPLQQLFPQGIYAGKGATIEIIPPQIDAQDIMIAAPTLTMKKYVLTQGANLDGSDGQVMVEIPEHWRKVYTYTSGSATMVRAMISPYMQDGTGWIHIKKGYVSAYEAAIVNSKLCSISNITNLSLSMVSGKVNATCDVTTASGQSDITSQLPTTSVTMDTLRTAARARSVVSGETNWNQLVYEQYLTICWLYYIEYANLNCQDAFTTALSAEGYHQGGLGNGVTTVGSSQWNTFNGYRPFVPCGITNCLGNQSGEVLLALPSTFGTNVKVAVPSYRGIENIFGHIWKFADGIKYLGDGTQQAVLRCDNPANYSSASASTNYTSIGNNYGDNGWKKKIMIGDDGDINCKAVGGGSNQAYCDYNYQAHANGTYYCCLLGGAAVHGAAAGLGCVASDFGVGRSDVGVSSRLSYFNK